MTVDRAELRGELRFRDVGFAYDDGPPDARATSTSSAAPGTRVAVVGETGSGKTTLGYLAARLYDSTGRGHDRRRTTCAT